VLSSVKLRSYQSAAIAALEAHWISGGGAALIEMATATGKSLVIGEAVGVVGVPVSAGELSDAREASVGCI
jgi:superfamily II DNA or RNA helicase